MASEPERSSDVGKRMSLATTSVIVVMSHLFSRTLTGQDPQPGLLGVAGARASTGLGVADPEAHLAQHRYIGFAVVVAPHHRRPPTFPVLVYALVVRDSHGRQKHPSRTQPAVNASQEPRVAGPWHVDDRVEGDHRVEGLRREGYFGHVRLEEGAFGDVLSGEFQLLG